jgi:uncharacterized protein (DUF2147 family)
MEHSRNQNERFPLPFMERNVKKIGLEFLLVVAIVVLIVTPIFAQDLSPIGRWNTISDKTGKATSIVEISLQNGELFGVVSELLGKRKNPNPLCKKCEGEKKDQPIKGLNILWGLKQDGDEWNGGYILDPDNGTAYRCIITLSEDGQQLYVRGYIGFSLFGRTQTWLKAD